MKVMSSISTPCVIKRDDTNEFMRFGENVILFIDSTQAVNFVNMFPMMFPVPDGTADGAETPFIIVEVNMESVNEIDMKGFIWYNDIEDKMVNEKNYIINRMTESIKEELKDE